MALYRPIVDISGNLIELPDGDYIKPNLLGSNIPTVDTVLTGNNTWVMGASFNYWTKTGNDLSYVLGNVGIGTDNPTNKLEVVTGATGAYFTRLSGNVGVTAPAIGLLTATTTTRINSFGDALQFFTGVVGSTTTQKMTILSSGEVGIGVSNPSRELTLKESYVLGWRYTTSNEGSFHRITGGGANPINFKVDYTSGVFTPVFTFDGNATNILTMLNGGNVGIGTAIPSQKLTVAGNIMSTEGGTDALPKLTLSASTTTGIYTPMANGWGVSTNAVSRLVIDAVGNVGIGTTNPTQKLDVAGGARFTNDVIIGGGAVGVNSLIASKNITGGVDASGIRSSGQIQSDVTNSAFMFRAVVNQANFDLPTLIVYESQIGTVSGTGTLFVNFRAVANPTGFTNVYGFQGLVGSGTNRWNLYMSGTANNYMAGSLGIGTTSLAGYGIRNSKTITGGASGFSHANYSDGQIQSDVTGAAWYFRTFANTQPTAFTLPEIRHFDATQGTIGAGSSVTVQTAFLAGSTLVGASFANYGFRGAIPAGTGRWNAFMDGTAYNLLAGRTFIGSTAENGSKVLQVNGGIRQTDVISGLVFANAQGEFATATAANIAATLGAGNYIQNQVAGPQASANFYIDGYGRADTFRAGQKGYLGTYTGASQLHGIWTLSSTFVIDTSLGTFGNQYGLAYGHTNNTGGVALPDGTTTKKPITGWGHQILFTENGIVRSGISLTNGNTWQAGQAVFGNFSTTLYSSTSYSIIHPTAESYLANSLQLGKTGTGGILRFRRPTDGLLAGAVGFIDNNTINITSFGGGGIISFTTSTTEKMRITDVGRLLVGYNADVNTYKVQINSGSATDNGLYVNGHIRATGNIIADGFFSGTSSDLRYKSNFEAVKVLNVIDKINVYSYNHKLYNDARLIGSVAQELEKHFPQLITKDTNGYLRVDNYGYSALALQLGKEIKSEVDLLKDRVKELEAKIQTLEKE